jgi:hypothetical protein
MRRPLRTVGLGCGLLLLGAIACRQPTVHNTASNPEEVLTSVVGTWQMEDRSTGELKPFRWTFTEDGELIYSNLPTEPSTFVGAYRIDSAPDPMHMDLQMPGEDVIRLTIFEFTEDGDMKVRLGAIQTDYRPDEFTGGDTILRKISDAETP